MIYSQNNNLATISRMGTEKQIEFIKSIDDNYSFNVRLFTTWLESTGQPIAYDSIRAYFKKLNQSKYSASTINLKRAAVKKRIKQLQDSSEFNAEEALKIDRALSQLDRDPETKARKINDAGIGMDKMISTDEYLLLMENARSERQKMFMEFLWSTGLRVSEMAGIMMSDCKVSARYISIRILGKGSNERHIKVAPELFKRVIATFNSRTWLFGTSTDKRYSRNYISGQITKLGKHVLHRQISAHSFRHSFITRKIKETGKLKAVSVYAGHSSITTTSRYLHEELSNEELFA